MSERKLQRKVTRLQTLDDFLRTTSETYKQSYFNDGLPTRILLTKAYLKKGNLELINEADEELQCQ
jgi:hypothetical protein